MGRHIIQAKKQTINSPIDIIILSAGQGRRMKSFGSKSLFDVGGRTLIEHQIDTIRSLFTNAEIVIVLGYELDKIEKILPSDIRIIENPGYESSTSAKSATLGIKACSKSDILIINGDLWFNNKSIDIVHGETAAFVDSKFQISKDKAGVVVSKDYITSFGYGMDTMWGQMVVLHSGDIEVFQKVCRDTKHAIIISEVFNAMISKGSEIKAVEPIKNKVVEIDTLKDLERIK